MRLLSVCFALLISSSVFGQTSIFDMARSGDIEAAKALATEYPDTLSSVSDRGYTPMILAAYYDQLEFAQFLVDSEVRLKDEEKQPTALQAASYKGFTEMVTLLIQYGSKPNTADPNGATALSYAVQFQHVDIVRILVNAGANPEIKDQQGFSALDYAKKFNNEEVLAALVRE